MRKIKPISKKLFRYLILFVFCVAQIVSLAYRYQKPMVACAETTTNTLTAEEPVSVALSYITELAINTKDTTVRVYSTNTDPCYVPIYVSENCTLIFDHVQNLADLTIADGCTVQIQLIGENQIRNIIACGGFQTMVNIYGNSKEDILYAQQIACAPGGSAATAACLSLKSCRISSKSIGCGMDGANTSYWDSSATIARATPGSNASPLITIEQAQIDIDGDIACGGDGVYSIGTWSACASNGGNSGEVQIINSEVSVTGNMSVGGTGGNGETGGTYYKCAAGNTKNSSAVRILQQSNVSVNGNVATSPNLPSMSEGGTQHGLNGVTVTVSDSTLTAKDIASGGSGHRTIRNQVYSSAGTSYDICGTAGGNGGMILANNATITCETAVCGANAGDYMNYEISMYGTTSGDTASERHPLDGNGGSIIAENSCFTIQTHAGAKGNRWNGYPNPSTYANSRFLGGVLNGTVYGDVIETDMTALVESETQKGFVASTEIRNSAEETCAKCIIQTDGEMSEQPITIQANDLSQQTVLDTAGTLCTYLGVGKEKLTIQGTNSYIATVMVKRSEALNVFQLTPYGRIAIDRDSVSIEANGYAYQNEYFEYQSPYTIIGSSAQNDVSVTSGEHHISVGDTSFDSLEIKGTASVTLHLTGDTTISHISVDETASLQIVGNGSLSVQSLGHLTAASGAITINEGSVSADILGSPYGGKDISVSNPEQLSANTCYVTLRNEQGNRMFFLTIGFMTGGHYELELNEIHRPILIDDTMEYTLLLQENEYQLSLSQDCTIYKGDLLLNKSQYIFQSDLTLYIDNSKGNIIIEDETVTLGERTIAAENAVTICQSDATIHPITVLRKSAIVTLDHVRADTPFYLCDDFHGTIQNHAGMRVLPVTIHTSYPLQEAVVELDGESYTFMTDKNGDFTCLLSEGSHALKIQIADVVYETKRSWNFSDCQSGANYSLSQLIDEQNTSTNSSNPTTDDENLQSGSATDEASNPENASTPSSSTSSSSTSSSSIVIPQVTDKQTVNLPTLPDVTAIRDNAALQNTERMSAHSDVAQESASEIEIQSSLEHLELLPVSASNTYQLYSKKPVTIKITRKEGYQYYYQLVQKGKKYTPKKWIKLDSSKLTVKQSGCRQRIVLKAVTPEHQTILKKTTGFYIDISKPVIKGVKHLKIYKKPVNISIQDDGKIANIQLNGKKKSGKFSVSKKGLYVLTASDKAGHTSMIVFAIM